MLVYQRLAVGFDFGVSYDDSNWKTVWEQLLNLRKNININFEFVKGILRKTEGIKKIVIYKDYKVWFPDGRWRTQIWRRKTWVLMTWGGLAKKGRPQKCQTWKTQNAGEWIA